MISQKPRAAAAALPPGLAGLDDMGTSYFKILTAGGRSIHRDLEATVEIAMRALVETYPELYREPHSDDSAEIATAAKLVDQCGRRPVRASPRHR